MNLNQQTKPLANKYAAYQWVKKVINSCDSIKQLISCTKLINNFHDLYKDTDLMNDLYVAKTRRRMGVKWTNSPIWDTKRFQEGGTIS